MLLRGYSPFLAAPKKKGVKYLDGGFDGFWGMEELGVFIVGGVTKKYNMKYLLQTSPLVYSAIAILILYQLNFTSILLAGGISIYWIITHIITIQKERNLLKEGSQYYIDSFESIRAPLTLVHTP